MSSPLEKILHAIDDVNRNDPHKKEGPYSEKLTSWVKKLQSHPSEELLIAARGQHIARWTIPREQYPMDRGGYLRWREDLKKFHASKVGELMKQCGYESPSIEKVQQLILKKNIKGDADTQTLEDALCLVFLETQFSELRLKTPPEKMVTIVKKTWGKMSSQGQQAALSLPYTPDDQHFLLTALQ